MMKKKLALIPALALVMLFALPACKGGDKPDANNTNGDGQTIRIGHIVDKTGVETLTGQEAERSLAFALEQMGGQIAGHPVEIIVGDTENSSDTAVSVARKMVESNQVDVLFGPTQIGHKTAVANYAAEAGVPMICYNGTPADLLAANETVFSSGGSPAQLATAMADYLYNELKYRAIDTIAQESAGGHYYMDALAEEFTNLGGTVVSSQYVTVSTFNYDQYMNDLPEADAIVAWVSGSDAVALWKAWFYNGVSEVMPMHAASHGGFTDYYICDELNSLTPEVLGAMLKGTYAPITYTYSLDSEENNTFVKAWEAKYGEEPHGTNLPGATYSALQLLAAAVESIDGDIDSQKLCQAIQNASITSPEGHLYFAEGERIATKDVHIVKLVQLEDGSFNYEIQKTYHDVPTTGLS